MPRSNVNHNKKEQEEGGALLEQETRVALRALGGGSLAAARQWHTRTEVM